MDAPETTGWRRKPLSDAELEELARDLAGHPAFDGVSLAELRVMVETTLDEAEAARNSRRDTTRAATRPPSHQPPQIQVTNEGGP